LRPDSRCRSPGRSSLGVCFPFRSVPRLGCPRSGCFAPIACATCSIRPSPGKSPLLGFLLPRAHDAGCPSSPRRGLAPTAEKVKVAKPPPVPSSGFLPLSTVLAALAARTNPLRSPPLAVTPRRFAALFHAARAPGVALQSLPLPRSRTRSRGPLLPCEFALDQPSGAVRSEVFATPFPVRADLSPRLAREGSPDWEAGTKVPWSR